MGKPLYGVLLLLTVLATVAGVVTLVPRAQASWPNILGYRSVCTFAPAASIFCLLIAGASCFVRSTFVKDSDGSAGTRIRRHAGGLVALVLVLALAVAATVWFVSVKAAYPDAGSSATTSG